mmetsp:Transcript_76360/g.247699  ORF Transcript_76360/g.247699 Transcript_76360/m.247699 type:complete len:276 (-) Transcript_76360:3-830(-)
MPESGGPGLLISVKKACPSHSANSTSTSFIIASSEGRRGVHRKQKSVTFPAGVSRCLSSSSSTSLSQFSVPSLLFNSVLPLVLPPVPARARRRSLAPTLNTSAGRGLGAGGAAGGGVVGTKGTKGESSGADAEAHFEASATAAPSPSPSPSPSSAGALNAPAALPVKLAMLAERTPRLLNFDLSTAIMHKAPPKSSTSKADRHREAREAAPPSAPPPPAAAASAPAAEPFTAASSELRAPMMSAAAGISRRHQQDRRGPRSRDEGPRVHASTLTA